MVVTKVSQMLVDCRNKSTRKITLRPQVYQFTWSSVLHWTNESQRLPQEIAAEALDFIVHVVFCPTVMETTRHHGHILDMDQPPIPFTYNAREMLEIVRRRIVHTMKSTCDTKRATTFVMLTVIANR
jgi:hypothetical protein